MKTHELHRWDVTYREAAAIQEDLRGMLILRDDGLPDPVGTVAGADISYDRGSDLFFAAAGATGFPNRSAGPIWPSITSGRNRQPFLIAAEEVFSNPAHRTAYRVMGVDVELDLVGDRPPAEISKEFNSILSEGLLASPGTGP